MTSTIDKSSARPILWVTGAGSGMGRAVAVSAATRGYRVALSGRRVEALKQTAKLITIADGESLTVPLDATRQDDVLLARDRILNHWGSVSHLVVSAGTNVPHRFWRDQTMRDFNDVVQTNLVAAASMVTAVLPSMRAAGDGVVVFVSSYAGWRFNPGSGIAYSASKSALSSLSESLNAEENPNGIRSCHFCPSDTDTDFLAMRPEVPDTVARQGMLVPEDVAAAVQFVLDAPPHVCVNEIVLSPTRKSR